MKNKKDLINYLSKGIMVDIAVDGEVTVDKIVDVVLEDRKDVLEDIISFIDKTDNEGVLKHSIEDLREYLIKLKT